MTRHRVILCLFLVASTATTPEAGANQVVFSDSIYADADWTIVNQFGLVSAGQQLMGGNPGTYRQVALSVGQNVPFVGQLNRNFVYNPSVSGKSTGSRTKSIWRRRMRRVRHISLFSPRMATSTSKPCIRATRAQTHG